MTAILNGWEDVALDDICDVIRGITFPTAEKRFQPGSGLIACLRTANVQNTVEWDDLWFVPKQYVKNDEQLVAVDDILISTANSYELVGKASRVTHMKHVSTLGAFISLLRAYKGIDAGYLYYQMSSEFVQRRIREMSSTTTNISNVSGAKLKTLRLNIAPLPEQTRIVAKLEELLSDLDAGVAELKAAQKKLGQYRQSLLKAAVEGALTAEWRTNNTPSETGAQLLVRILTERRARWETKQLAKFQAQGKPAPKDWQKKYPEPVQPDTTDLPELPAGWVWATLSQVGWLDRGRSKHRPRNAPHLYGGPYPFVQTGDIRHADTFLSDVEATYSEAGLAQSRLWPVGTMCITIAANIGKTAILSMEACFPDSVVGFLSGSDDVSIRYVEYFMRSVQQKLEDEAPATAQKNINLEILEKVVIPIPPTPEQHQLVKLLDDSMGTARESDQAIDLSLKQSTAQRQNILRAAFAGELVPQDPNDEAASVLLEGIRAERTSLAISKKPRGRKAKEST